MIRFAPNVYISSYLNTTTRLTHDVLNRMKTILEGGYQRELSYVHNDGSFSAFENNDKSGTTWLTAFVIISFSQAASFTYIDIKVITKAVQWIIKQQKTSGAFNEPGIVLHKEMQGGSLSSKRSLTAFVLIALLEARDNKQVSTEVAVYFNVNNDLRQPAFALTTTVLNDSTKGFRLRVCFRLINTMYISWLRGGQSTMGILEISLPSGMEADLESIDTTNTGGQYKKVEKAFRNEAVTFYQSKALANATIIEVCGPNNCEEVKVKTVILKYEKRKWFLNYL
ncbi:CD109 [Mytilus coruscus]|uniref:CD109 n=1 Tax=Mytilus coruscus TaxID=42192 RepID=A0A6J7ZYB9_MYTCO|nr:CD109 [Mytilus coruscus]